VKSQPKNRIGFGLHTFRLLLLGSIVSATSLVACQPPDVAPSKTTVIRIAGATAMQPVLYDLTTAFTRQHPTILFEVAGGGSTIGEERLAAGQIDLAASTLLSPTVPNTGLQERSSSSAIRTPIGIDGLTLIVHPSNPIENLTTEQLQALYRGNILTWAEVGGSLTEVLLTSREDGSGSRQLFETRIMGKDRVSLTAVVMPSNADTVAYVAKHPDAIGYVSRAYVTPLLDPTDQRNQSPAGSAQNAPDTPAVKVVALDGQLPTQPALQSQSYPLLQPIYLVSPTRPTGWLQQFIDFALSPAGQAIVGRYHARVR